jgi:antitoxin component YwqK of YwqJK toxin-antitoxin module
MKTETRKEYHSNGKIKSEYNYVNGIQHGIQKNFHRLNGKLHFSYVLNHGIDRGVTHFFIHHQ